MAQQGAANAKMIDRTLFWEKLSPYEKKNVYEKGGANLRPQLRTMPTQAQIKEMENEKPQEKQQQLF